MYMIGGRLGQVQLPDSGPPSPDCCAIGEIPPDRALDENGGYAVMLGGSDTIAFVQDKVIENAGTNSTVTVTLDAAPTTANVLIAALRERGTSPSLSTFPTGWTQQASFIGVNFDGGVMTLWTKVVAPGDSASILVTKHRGVETRLYVAEFAGVAFDQSDDASAVGVATSLTAGPMTPGNTPSLVLAAFDQSARTATYTWPGGWTEVDDDNSNSGSGPSSTIGYQVFDPSVGPYSVTVTSTESDNYGWGMLAFIGATADWVVPAPLTIDGDDATYNTHE